MVFIHRKVWLLWKYLEEGRDVNELAYFIATSLFFHNGNIHKDEQDRIAIFIKANTYMVCQMQ